jgi:hypothetical protein
MKKFCEYLMSEGLSVVDGIIAIATLVSLPLPVLLFIFSNGYLLIFLGTFLFGVAAFFVQRRIISHSLLALTKYARERFLRKSPA